MKKLLLLLLLLPTATRLRAQGDEWQNAEVNAVNRLPMHAAFFAYESADAAAADDRTASQRYLSLDGPWRFLWVRNADQRPEGFFRPGYDDRAWGTIPVPGLWELNGYGDPLYVNVGYAWREQFENNPPYVPVAENHVGSYRRTVTIPASWSGEQVIAHIGSATSNVYLWVNGRLAGYSEDSKLEAEFDITHLLRPGENLLAMQIFRWSDGTYLEDQDFFRLSGIGRSCYLYARDKRHIDDIRVNAALTNDYTHGELEAVVELPAAAKGCRVELALTSPDGKPVASEQQTVKGGRLHFRLDAGQVAPWSAEIPTLYDLRATLSTADGRQIETIPLRVGFRDVRIEQGLLKVNGKPVLLKGANRHEMDPDYGYVVSEERMLQDIRLLKEHNFNAVRTCHYPDANRWYELCDQYGLYIVAEANIESHGMGYGERTLAKNPAYAKAHLERNERHVRRNFNHPSVIVWSLGNEAGDGANFDACYDWIKQFDPSRPVQHEQANGGRNSDIRCPMYWDYDTCEKYASANPEKPLIQCEYAHAMGNSLGGFGEYWQLIRRLPSYQGGFIWDFVDQSLRKSGKNGVMVYGYGGDWNPYDASDGNFCDNGLISPDRVPNPHMREAGYWQQAVWTSLAGENELDVYNEYLFRNLDNCYLRWEILCDGEPVRGGIVDRIEAGPQQHCRITLPYAMSELPAEGELLLNVSYRLRNPEQLMAPDHALARQQLTLRGYEAQQPEIAERRADRHTSLGELRIVDNDRNYLIVESPLVRLDISRRTGFITRYEAGGRALLAEGAVLQPNFWRAPTDNDFGAGLQRKNRVWENPGLKLESLDHELAGGVATVTAQYTLEHVDARLTLTYRIDNAGEVAVAQSLRAAEGAQAPDLMRFGLRMEMPAAFDRIDYYGRGPWENYADRKDAAFLGRYRQTVDEQPYAYIRQQETGTKSDVRRWRQTDMAGRGIEFTAAAPFYASALHNPQEDLDEGLEKRQGHSQEVAPRKGVYLCFDGSQYGLGCIDSWGQLPRPEYRMPMGDYDFCLKLRPIR